MQTNGERTLPIIRTNVHMLIQWNLKEIMFTKSELLGLHHHFYHPQERNLYNLLKMAKPEDCTPGTLNVLEDIGKKCCTCIETSPRPYRFRVSVPAEKVVFNEELSLDLMWLDIGRSKTYQSCILLIPKHTIRTPSY